MRYLVPNYSGEMTSDKSCRTGARGIRQEERGASSAEGVVASDDGTAPGTSRTTGQRAMIRPPGDQSTWSLASFWPALAIIILLASAGCAGVGLPTTAKAAHNTVSAAPSPRHALRPSPRQAPRQRPRPARVVITHIALSDRHQMTVARFTGAIKFVLHCGSSDPGSSCQGLPGGPWIPPKSRPRLVAAFNGGFLLSTGSGGYEQAGRVISPLQRGRASLVIYRSGAASIGAWGYHLPKPGERIYSVRQNLSLLVRNGHPTAAALATWTYWGATLGGGELVARSALGENAKGQLIYVGSMSASPWDLATALVSSGARTAMELDINPEWVQLAYAKKPGGRLRRGVIGQSRPPDQYLIGWTRDFIAVMVHG